MRKRNGDAAGTQPVFSSGFAPRPPHLHHALDTGDASGEFLIVLRLVVDAPFGHEEAATEAGDGRCGGIGIVGVGELPVGFLAREVDPLFLGDGDGAIHRLPVEGGPFSVVFVGRVGRHEERAAAVEAAGFESAEIAAEFFRVCPCLNQPLATPAAERHVQAPVLDMNHDHPVQRRRQPRPIRRRRRNRSGAILGLQYR